MISGEITARREAEIRLTVKSPDGPESLTSPFVIDTGFDGYLTLPQFAIDSLELPRHSEITIVLGDGSETKASIYYAVVSWNDTDRPVRVMVAETAPLIGIALLYSHDVHLHLLDGGLVTVARI